MAIIKKLGKKSVATPKEKISLSLPDEINTPSDELRDYSILLYGAKKIGKTSLASRFPDAYFLSLEPGTKALRVLRSDVRKWEELDGYLKLLEETDRFRTIIVDTVDLAYEYAFDYICRKKVIKHPNEENDYGATWREIAALFRSFVMRILRLNRGVVFISHDMEREIELRDGTKIDRVQPTMDRKAMAVVEAVVDLICNYSYDGKRRVLRIDGSQETVAGCRLEEHFLRKGGSPRVAGDRIQTIDMGNSSQESYDNFIAAFNNQQSSVTHEQEAPKLKKKLSLR